MARNRKHEGLSSPINAILFVVSQAVVSCDLAEIGIINVFFML